MDASKTVFVNHTAVIVVTKGVYSGMGMIPKDCFGNVAIINEALLSIDIHKVNRYTRGMSALLVFSTNFSLMLEGKEAKSFDVTTGHTPTMPYLNYSWGEHCEV